MNQPANPWHVDLKTAGRFFPTFTMTPRSTRIIRWLTALLPGVRASKGVTVEDVHVPGPKQAPAVRVRVYRASHVRAPAPALLWIHGGGYVIGRPEMDDELCVDFARELGIVVVSVDYRLAPEHPFPAPLEDCYAALHWVFSNAEALGIVRERIGIGGASAGGGLAAALAQLAHERREHRLVMQVLVYPMLDDRTTARVDIEDKHLRGWNQPSNVFGWQSYLGQAPNGPDAPKHAVPARCEDLSGLPPAWIGVGTCDLFHDEDLAYAERLKAAHVPCEFVVVPGAFHGFDRIPGAAVAKEFRRAYSDAIRRGLQGEVDSELV